MGSIMNSQGRDESIGQRTRSHWALLIILGIIPNLLLAAAGLLFVIYGISLIPVEGWVFGMLLLMAGVISGPPILNLLIFLKPRKVRRQAFYWAAVVATIGHMLLALWLCKVSVEGSDSFLLLPAACFAGTSAFTLLAHAWHRLASRPIRFTLKQLGLFTGACGVFLAIATWVTRLDRIGKYSEQAAIARHFEALGGHAQWQDWEVTAIYFEPTELHEKDFEMLSQLPALEALLLEDDKLTDVEFDLLVSVSRLETLQLHNVQLPYASLEKLTSLTKLENLGICGTGISDDELVHLLKLTELKHLDLSDTTVTDGGAEYLTQLKRLRFLDLSRTKVTGEGFSRLRKELPNCLIYGPPTEGD